LGRIDKPLNDPHEAYTGNIAGRRGERTSLKQYSSVRNSKADGDCFNELGSQNRGIDKGKISEDLPESKSVACNERNIRNPGDPLISSY
jgi:hypothetical protein